MHCVSKRPAHVLRVVLWSALLCLPILLQSSPAAAATPAPASAVIRAVVSPVRYVVVNKQDDVMEILSNTTHAVTPEVYLNSLQGAQSPLTPRISRRYTIVRK